jgi:glutamyl-Q tRNA(Asp) synthetase
MPDKNSSYRGRFAPSPTGPLHLGSLIAALASFLDARKHGGSWLVRMDDLDPPREQSGAADSILNSLASHGLHWDEDILWQSQGGPAYEDALSTLAQSGQTFNCDCPRKDLGPDGSCIANCWQRQAQITAPCATRITVDRSRIIGFDDALQGAQSTTGAEIPDNFTIKRRDGLYAYQLAVVVDDARQKISHIVRGSDLLSSTARQIYLQRTLGLPTPDYCHLPVITNRDGQKYSKQNHATALSDQYAAQNLRRALEFLQQQTPPEEATETGSILSFACQHWAVNRVPGEMAISETSIIGASAPAT